MSVATIDDITPEMIRKAQQTLSEGTAAARSHEDDEGHDTAAELGAVISADMVKKGLSIDQVAERLNTSAAFVSQCLNRHGVQDFSAE